MHTLEFVKTISGLCFVFKLRERAGEEAKVSVTLENRSFTMIRLNNGNWRFYPANEVLDLLAMEKDLSDAINDALTAER